MFMHCGISAGRCLRLSAAVLLLAWITVFFVNRTASAASQEVQISGFTLVLDGESGRWEISASEAIYGKNALIEMKDIDARLLVGENLRVAVEGPVGSFDPDKKVLILENGVEISTFSGYSFSASRVVWDGTKSFLRARGKVTFRYFSMMVRSDNLMHKIDSGVLAMEGQVRAQWISKGDN